MNWRLFGHGLLVLACVSLSVNRAAGQQPKTKQRQITVSETTTRIIEPLTAEGYVDYSRAVNAVNAVPYKDNAAAQLIEIGGVPMYWEDVQREKLKKALGLKVLPVSGENLKSQYDFERDQKYGGMPVPDEDERLDQDILASSRPWASDEAPFIARWIEANSIYLAKVDSILTKSGYYEPMMGGRERDLGILPTSCDVAWGARRSLAELLLCRCFLHLGERRYEKAIEDILRIHKLARLGKKSKLVAEIIAGSLLETRALNAGVKMLESTQLDRDSLRFYLKSLEQLGPIVTAKDLCSYHRLCHLATVSVCARESPKTFIGHVQVGQELVNSFFSAAGIDDLVIEPTTVPFCCKVDSDLIDWNYLARKINRRYDRVEVIHALPDTVERLRSIQAFAKDTRQEKIRYVHRLQFKAAREKDEQEATRQLTDDVDVVLNDMLNFEHHSAYKELSLKARLDLVRIMAAARLHEQLHGELPKTYDAIKNYFAELPVDPYSAKPYRWKSTNDALEISSDSNDYVELPRAFRELKVTVRARPK